MSIAAAILLAGSSATIDLAVIDSAVAGFTGAAIGVPGGAMTAVDRRLRLKPCAAPLALSWRGARRDSVLVQCPDAGGWKLFVPVRARPAAVPAEAEPPAVTRGDSVSIVVQGAGFSISRPGEALESGSAGVWIRVRPDTANPRGGDTFRARVIRPGVVFLPVS